MQVPVEFHNMTSYGCNSDQVYFSHDREAEEWNLTCLADGSWEAPAVWPSCINSELTLLLVFCQGVNCSAPPVRPLSGTWEWDGGLQYG